MEFIGNNSNDYGSIKYLLYDDLKKHLKELESKDYISDKAIKLIKNFIETKIKIFTEHTKYIILNDFTQFLGELYLKFSGIRKEFLEIYPKIIELLELENFMGDSIEWFKKVVEERQEEENKLLEDVAFNKIIEDIKSCKNCVGRNHLSGDYCEGCDKKKYR